MTLMLILGAVAMGYCLLLLFRCAKFALPVFAGLSLAFYLRDQESGWIAIFAGGLLAGVAVLVIGRQLAVGTAPLALRLCVILLFAGAAGAAGFQAGTGLAILAGLDSWSSYGLSIVTALLTGLASWRDLLSPQVGIARSSPRA